MFFIKKFAMAGLSKKKAFPKSQLKAALVTLALGFVLSCGRMDRPFTPEQLSATQVGNLQVTGEVDGLKFVWLAPEVDRLGKPLKSLEGYQIMRKELNNKSDFINEKIGFEEIATIRDSSMAQLKVLKDEARAKGLPTRRVKLSETSRTYSYTDKTPERAHRYLYKVVPINQGDEEGSVRRYASVLFDGVNSKIVLTNSTGEEDLGLNDQASTPPQPAPGY